MSVRVEGRTIRVEGNGPVEDAEPIVSPPGVDPDAVAAFVRGPFETSSCVTV